MPSKAPTKDDILKLEKSYWDAMKAKDGPKSVVTSAKGVMTIDNDRMGKMTETGDWELISYAFDKVEVSIPTPDVAIIAYEVRQKVRMKGDTQEIRAADSSTWLRGAYGWKCHAHSETFLEAA